ncbi:hypothetical protein J0A67_09925 [Algoriphagus aestuariicola]|uniref:Photosynthesis system II assembly factor Ycf48/Hcf136-like domain-containing protein n=1 Tax=Algoriphagus aestuariicola TaxID=1852016 RepID=A0ABS3BS57_9BACT|nr:YCF48-related protein [Algoriphagus aestuariicola]MBN7801180.1 hypothetical protein [Algoriphagus aestuariicola]
MKPRSQPFWYLFPLLSALVFSCELESEGDTDPVIEDPIIEVVDGGLDTLGNWTWVDFGEVELAGDEIVFASPDTVYLINRIFFPFPGFKVSYDGGNTWLPNASQYNIIRGFNWMHVIDHDNIFLYGRYAPMLSQSNYNAIIYNLNFNDLPNSTYRNFYYEGWYGYIADVGSRGDDVYALNLSSKITIKGKKDWVEYNLNRYSRFETLVFASDSVGFVGSDEGELLMTRDRNNSWESILQDPDDLEFVELFFYNTELGFALTNSNVMYRTADGGENWSKILLPHNAELQETYYLNKKIVMVDQSRGFTNYGREVFETKDGGITWTRTLRVGKTEVEGISYDQVGAIWAVTGQGLLKMELD